MGKQYFVKRAGKVGGPITSNTLKQQVENGKVSASDQLGSSPKGPWKRVDSIPTLSESLPEVEDEWQNDEEFEELDSYSPLSYSAATDSVSTATSKSKSPGWLAVGLAGGLCGVLGLVVGAGGVFLLSGSETPPGDSSATNAANAPPITNAPPTTNKTPAATTAKAPADSSARSGLKPMHALHGQWRVTHSYRHNDNNNSDGKPGGIAEDYTDDKTRTMRMFYDTKRKVWSKVYPNGTVQSGTFDVLPDDEHAGKFRMIIHYKDGSGGPVVGNRFFLTKGNRQLDEQWTRTVGKGFDATRWVYVDDKAAP
jgi:hypothetical protein